MKRTLKHVRWPAIEELLGRGHQRGIDAAHDLVADETDDLLRRQLYRLTYAWCIKTGHWANSRIFFPFTGYRPDAPAQRDCVKAAITMERLEDALEGAARIGYEFDLEELRRLADAAATQRGRESFLWQAIHFALEDRLENVGRGSTFRRDNRLVLLLCEARRRALTDAEEVALDLATESYDYLRP